MSDELNSPRILCQQCMRHEGSGVYVSAHDLTTLRTQLAAMTAERDALQSQCNNQRQIIDDSLKPHATLIAERGAALARAERAERLLDVRDAAVKS